MRFRLLVLVALALSSVSEPIARPAQADQVVTLAGTTTASSVGTTVARVHLDQSVRFKEGDETGLVHLTGSGAYQGFMLAQLPQQFFSGDRIFLLQFAAPVGCTTSGLCEPVTEAYSDGIIRNGIVTIAPGDYALYLLAPDGASVDATLQLPGLSGTTSVDPTMKIHEPVKMQSVAAIPWCKPPVCDAGVDVLTGSLSDSLQGPGEFDYGTWMAPKGSGGGGTFCAPDPPVTTVAGVPICIEGNTISKTFFSDYPADQGTSYFGYDLVLADSSDGQAGAFALWLTYAVLD